MSDAFSQSPPELTFEEIVLSRSAQLFADPLTDSTRKRQSLLLILSTLSLAIFFGIVVPEKLSLPGFEMRATTTPQTSAGTTSTSCTGIAKGSLRFNKVVLCPVILYSVLAFWLSVYRDHEAANYLKQLAESDIARARVKEELVNKEKSDEALAFSERFLRDIANTGKRKMRSCAKDGPSAMNTKRNRNRLAMNMQKQLKKLRGLKGKVRETQNWKTGLGD